MLTCCFDHEHINEIVYKRCFRIEIELTRLRTQDGPTGRLVEIEGKTRKIMVKEISPDLEAIAARET